MFGLLKAFNWTVVSDSLLSIREIVLIKTVSAPDGEELLYVAPKAGIYNVKNMSSFVTKIAKYFPKMKMILPYKTREGNFKFGELQDNKFRIRIIFVPDSNVLSLIEERKYVTISCFSVRMYGFCRNLGQFFLEH